MSTEEIAASLEEKKKAIQAEMKAADSETTRARLGTELGKIKAEIRHIQNLPPEKIQKKNSSMRTCVFEVLPPVDEKLLRAFRANTGKIYPPKVVPCDDMRLEIGYGLIPLVEGKLGANLLSRMQRIRNWIIEEYGFQIPSIHIIDNLRLGNNEYRFYMKGKKIGGFKIPKNKYLCLAPKLKKNEVLNEIQITEPAFGSPAFLISKNTVERYFNDGHTIVDAPGIIQTHVDELIKSNFDELFTYDETKKVLSLVKKRYPGLLADVLGFYTASEICEILKNILKERKSIARIEKILELLITNHEIKGKEKLMKLIFKGIK
jgi:flagellar biosynthesis component FlhA